jgi:uncharacterized membrane protein YfcA
MFACCILKNPAYYLITGQVEVLGRLAMKIYYYLAGVLAPFTLTYILFNGVNLKWWNLATIFVPAGLIAGFIGNRLGKKYPAPKYIIWFLLVTIIWAIVLSFVGALYLWNL